MKFFSRIRHMYYSGKMNNNMNKFIAQLGRGTSDYIKAVEIVEAKYGHQKKPYLQATMLCFIKFSLIDLFELYKIYFRTTNVWERNLLARTMAIHISEFIDDVGDLVGKPMSTLIEKIKDVELEERLKSVRVVFHEIQTEYDKMRNIRNYASAHKDRDIRKQIEVIDKINDDDFNLTMVKFQLFVYYLFRFEMMMNKKIIQPVSQESQVLH